MTKIEHLVQYAGVWTYRRRIPSNLVPKYGEPSFQTSLGTHDLTAAMRRYGEADDARVIGELSRQSPAERAAAKVEAMPEGERKEMRRVLQGATGLRKLTVDPDEMPEPDWASLSHAFSRAVRTGERFTYASRDFDPLPDEAVDDVGELLVFR